MLNSNICTRPQNMVNFGPPTAQIGWRLWGTPANFNGFRVLASSLHRRHSTEVNQTLHSVWPSSGLIHYIYIFFWGGGLLPPNGILPGAKFTLRPSHAFSYIGSVTARHSSSGRQSHSVSGTRNGITELSLVVIFNRVHHLYSKGDHHVGHRPIF